MKKTWTGRWLPVLGLILLLLLSACGQNDGVTRSEQDEQETAVLPTGNGVEDEEAADAAQQMEADITTWQEQADLGMQQLAAGNYEEAIAAFTAAIELDPQGETAYSGLADTYVAMGEYGQAAAVWQDTWGGEIQEDALRILFAEQTQDQEIRTALQSGKAGIWITSAGVSQENMEAGAETVFRLTVLYNLPEDGTYVIDGTTNGEAPDSWELLTGEMEAESGAHLRQVELTAAPIQWAEETFCLKINLHKASENETESEPVAEDTWYMTTAGELTDGFLLLKHYEEEKTEESIKQALLSNTWDASAQTLELFQFFPDGTGVSLYSIPVPSVIPFTYSIDAATSTVTITITHQQDMPSTTSLWSYDAAEDKFSMLYTEYPNEKLESFPLFLGSVRETYQSQADYWETMWDQEISYSADQASWGNIVQGMRDLLESIRQYLGYVMTPEAFDALNRELEAWDQDVTAAMESIEWVGSISSLERLSVNKDRTMDKIAELIAQIP